MIPSHWFRRIALVAFIMEVVDDVLRVTGRLSTDPAARPMTRALSSLVFLLGFHINAPLSAYLLTPQPSQDAVLQECLARMVATVPDSRPVFLYDYVDKEASTMGSLPNHSRIYVITGLLASMSGEDMRGVTAYEGTHVHERHIFATSTYACCFAVSNHLLDNDSFLFAAFLLFLGTHRYCGYQADAGTTQSVGRGAILTTPCELAALHPLKLRVRRFSSANAYPALAIRMWTVGAGREALL